MKTLGIFLVVISLTVPGCGQSKAKLNLSHPIDESPYCLSQVDAGKILGQSSKLVEKLIEKNENAIKYKCTYTISSKTIRSSNLYYVFEDHKDIMSAKRAYKEIVLNNESMSGLKVINDIGDEAFLHTDGENFNLIISRKGDKILRLKVNKITNKTSSKEMELVSRKIASSI